MTGKAPKEAQTYIFNGHHHVLIRGDHEFWEKRRISSLKKVFAGLALAVAGAVPGAYGLHQIHDTRASVTPAQIEAAPIHRQNRFECLGQALKNDAATLGEKRVSIPDAVKGLEKSVEDCAIHKTRQSLVGPRAEFKRATALTICGFLSLFIGILLMSNNIEDSRLAKRMARNLRENLTPS